MTGDVNLDSERPIGGFLPLGLDHVPTVPGSVWDGWTAGATAVSTFGTARSALAALIEATRPRSVWLPAYICHELSDAAAVAVQTASAELRHYPLTPELEPDRASLEPALASGDLVVVVAFFGWPPDPSFCAWARARSDVEWVEDRAQALSTGAPAWATWTLYSPRKLIGVPNGGLLIGDRQVQATPATGGPADLSIGFPELLRFEDRAEQDNGRWYPEYQARERVLAQHPGIISRLTEALLRRTPLKPLVRARRANYDYLLKRLRPLAAWPRTAENVAPFGFVIAVEDAPTLARRLAGQGLFCARHWPQIGGDRSHFPFEATLPDRLLTLPCDQRYNPDLLARLAGVIEQIAPRPAPIQRPDDEQNGRDKAGLAEPLERGQQTHQKGRALSAG
jgi:hypothetical protein